AIAHTRNDIVACRYGSQYRWKVAEGASVTCGAAAPCAPMDKHHDRLFRSSARRRQVQIHRQRPKPQRLRVSNVAQALHLARIQDRRSRRIAGGTIITVVMLSVSCSD